MLTLIIIALILLSVVIYVAVGLFTMSLNDFLEKKVIGKFVWLWLPFHAFKRLTKEFREKFMK